MKTRPFRQLAEPILADADRRARVERYYQELQAERLQDVGAKVADSVPSDSPTAQTNGISLEPGINITAIEGIGPGHAALLREAGIRVVEALLAAGATAKGRKDLAERTGIPDVLILRWVHRADLLRLQAVSEVYACLLEAAGVESVRALARRRAKSLHDKLVKVNSDAGLVSQVPTDSQVAQWIADAIELPRVVTY